MHELRIGTAEAKFADVIWNNEPVSSGDLAKLANKEFEWKKTTSFTVLKRLCERGIFQNMNGIVTSLISRDEFYARKSEIYVEEAFGGSLPAFLNAFVTRKKLTDKEIDEIRRIIDSMRG
ncbi:MAG: BlaI/MecI/CopY family transcriptional regulator [Butyrivibrio sp.]|nr:BlaI/MecI/CopY family transcriptional regulator [Butyrivibrio sp.]